MDPSGLSFFLKDIKLLDHDQGKKLACQADQQVYVLKDKVPLVKTPHVLCTAVQTWHRANLGQTMGPAPPAPHAHQRQGLTQLALDMLRSHDTK